MERQQEAQSVSINVSSRNLLIINSLLFTRHIKYVIMCNWSNLTIYLNSYVWTLKNFGFVSKQHILLIIIIQIKIQTKREFLFYIKNAFLKG